MKKSISIIGLIMVLGGCNSSYSKAYSASDYEKNWPFPEQSQAIVNCKLKSFKGVKRPIVSVSLNGKSYGLNGAAHGVGGMVDARKVMAKSEWGTYKLGASSQWITDAVKNCK